jgi:hypothetical protein
MRWDSLGKYIERHPGRSLLALVMSTVSATAAVVGFFGYHIIGFKDSQREAELAQTRAESAKEVQELRSTLSEYQIRLH